MRRRGFLFLSGEAGVMPALHRHREVEVGLIACGELVFLFGGERVTLSAGRMAVFWATIPHGVVRTAPGTHFFCIHLPLARFLRWQISSEMTNRLLHGEMLHEQDPARFEPDLALFDQWRRDLKRDTADVNEVVLLELEARLRRLAWSCDPAPPLADRRSETGILPRDRLADSVERMAVFITRHYQERIGTAEIAEAVNLHPKYAAALFREHCGMTPGDYLTQQRLSQAQRLLATTDARVADIAYASGFGSVSQFYEVFTRHCGQSPKMFRATRK